MICPAGTRDVEGGAVVHRRADDRQAGDRFERSLRGLAELIRSDSQALRRMIEEKTTEQEVLLRETVEERMILVGEALVEKTAEAAEIAIASSLGETVERMSASISASTPSVAVPGMAGAGGSVSRMPAWALTISPSAQKVIPSP
jgi:hypothetical protein